jgi:ATP-dependent Clp protease ATP-binding subunit ClpC
LKRAIQKYVEDPLAEHIISANLQEGDSINLAYDDEKKGDRSEDNVKGKKKKKSEDQAESE